MNSIRMPWSHYQQCFNTSSVCGTVSLFVPESIILSINFLLPNYAYTCICFMQKKTCSPYSCILNWNEHGLYTYSKAEDVCWFFFHISLHSQKWNICIMYTYIFILYIHSCWCYCLHVACTSFATEPSSLPPSIQYCVSNRYKHELYLN